MFSGKDVVNPAYPTQWALNPNAYQNMDSSNVDWAALAQQWIAMKEAAAIVSAAPPTSKIDAEEGEAPMEVENPETNNTDSQEGMPEWNSATNSWSNSWNQWGWGWPGAGPVDPKSVDSSMGLTQMMDGYTVPSDGSAQIPGQGPTFQHGYWTAPQVDQGNATINHSSSRPRRSKSRNRDMKSSSRMPRSNREKPAPVPPVIEPIVMPTTLPNSTLDAAKRRQLPAWIREGLEKMEREKQRAIEREQELKARAEAESEQKKLEEAELARMKTEASGEPMLPPKSKFETDSEGEESDKELPQATDPQPTESPEHVPEKKEPSPVPVRSAEEIMQEVMLAVRRSLTEILLEVTDQEIHTVSQEELARYTTAQASRLNAMKASKSKALASIATGLGLGAYESSSEESEEDETNDLSDQQLQDIIRRKRLDFERTAREIEAEVRRAELREMSGNDPEERHREYTPEKKEIERSSVTPPLDGETPEKIPERRISKDKRNNHKSKSIDRTDSARRLDTIAEEKSSRKRSEDHTPSPPPTKLVNNNKKETSASSTDSEDSSTSTSTESEYEAKVESKRPKKRKRKSSSSERKKSKKQKKEKSIRSERRDSKSKHEKEISRKDDYKYRSHDKKDKIKERSKRSTSYESRRKGSRSRDGSEDYRRRRERSRDRSHDRSSRSGREYDRYERSRDYRRRSRSRSRHRR